MSAVKTSKSVGLIGLVSIVAGIVLIVAGAVTWGLVSSQLSDENITVSSVSEENPGAFAGRTVNGPLTAFAQANAINEHALAGSGGQTYAQLGGVVTQFKNDAKAAAGDDAELSALIDSLDIAGLQAAGASDEVVELTQSAAAAQGQRNTVMNGSFLRASLFTSVVAFGVAALVIGLGVMFTLLGFALRRLSSGVEAPIVVAAPARAAEFARE